MKKPLVFLTLLFVLGATSMQAPAASSGVVDNAQLFSAEAIKSAEGTISKLKQQRGVDTLVETFAEIPPEQKANVSGENLDAFFQSWMVSRAKANGVNGVYVLICKDPLYLRAGVGNDTVQKGYFTTADRDRLVRVMSDQLRARNFDEALLGGTRLVAEMVESHAGSKGAASGATPNQRSRGGLGGLFGNASCLWIGLIVLGVFVVIRMFTRRAAGGYGGAGGYGPQYGQGNPTYGPGGYGNPGYGAPMGGGGFGRGLFGGLLGGMAGGWLYDKMRGGSSAYGSSGDPGAGPMQPPQDTDYSGGGGLIDSGNDFGGGGGGDFGGGGDSGGGGGDF